MLNWSRGSRNAASPDSYSERGDRKKLSVAGGRVEQRERLHRPPGRLVIPFGEQLLAGRAEVRADGFPGDSSDLGSLGEGVAFGPLGEGPVEGFVNPHIASD